MTSIDATIPLGVKPVHIENPLAQMVQLAQLQSAQQTNDLASLKMQQMRREESDLQSLRSGVAEPGADVGKVLLGLGRVDEYAKWQKGQGDLKKSDAETEAKRIETAHKRVDMLGQASGWLRDNPTPDNAMLVAQHLQQYGILTPEQAQASIARIQADPSPQNIAKLATMAYQTALSAKDQLPSYQTRNTGGSTDTIAINPVTGGVQVANSVRNTQSPDNAATNARSAAEGAANRAVQVRGQNMTDARQRDANAVQQGQKTQQGVIELRKEFNALPEVKNYREVLPIIQSVQRAPDTPAGDIDVIYGVGKVMDPNSVVREGEMKLVIQSGSPMQRFQGLVNYVQNGGRLTQGQRQQLLDVMNSRVQGHKANYDAARTTFETAAERGGLPKDQIFIDNPLPPAPKAAAGNLTPAEQAELDALRKRFKR